MQTKNRHAGDTLLLPSPAKVSLTGGQIALPSRLSLYEESSSVLSDTFKNEVPVRNESDARGALLKLLLPSSVPGNLRRWTAHPEGYAMRVGSDGISIWASAAAGHLYGIVTLRQLLRQYGRRLPCLAIGDAPVLARRGVQLVFPQGHTSYRPAYMRDLVPQLARWKINELYLYLESYFDFPSLPHMAGPDAMTPAHARALDKLCRAYNIKLIPMLNTLAHSGEILATQRFQHLSEYPPGTEPRMVRPFNLCASSDEVRTLVDGMLNDLCDCFSSDTIHVGGDEVSCLGQCPRCTATGKKEALPLYVKYFNRVFDVLARRGRRGGIWGDMLLHYCPKMSKHDQKRLLAPFCKKAVIYDWHYSGGSRSTLDFFVKSGMETIACSSTNLCYSSALWIAQSSCQRDLFKDAAEAGANGGMTTAWANWNGLHEEQFNYLHASGGALLWSGVTGDGFAGPLTTEKFEAAYRLQRYGLRTRLLTDYLRVMGDARGPILSVLAPFHGVELRKCLYHTDNVLTFWAHYGGVLSGEKFKAYQKGVTGGRRLWNAMRNDPHVKNDPYFGLLVGPLIMHEHLILRYRMTEEAYRYYDMAAKAQYENPGRFRSLLEKAASRTLRHLRDFTPIEAYLTRGRALVGFDRSTLNRIDATKRNIRHLAAFLRHLKKSHRPLPAFQQLHGVFLDQCRTRWYGDREHDWAAEPRPFQRYSLNERGAWNAVAAVADREPKGDSSL